MPVRSTYLVGRGHDLAFFIAQPLIALAIAAVWSLLPASFFAGPVLGAPATVTAVVLRTIIHAHLVIVLFRSHANTHVFRQHPIRFTVVPLLLFVSMVWSVPLLNVMLIVTTFWDLYHSSMQTFGIGRIYDVRSGASPTEGRGWDLWLNHVLYIGPFLAGPLLGETFRLMSKFAVPGFRVEDPLPQSIALNAPAIGWFVTIAGVVFVVAYAFVTVRRVRRGAVISGQKLLLFACTGAVSIAAWGFNSFGMALFIVNVFHAVQYFALVWHIEKGSVQRVLFLKGSPRLALLGMVVVSCLYGFWIGAVYEGWATEGTMRIVVLSLSTVISVIHFWYDGFVWSVRRAEV